MRYDPKNFKDWVIRRNEYLIKYVQMTLNVSCIFLAYRNGFSAVFTGARKLHSAEPRYCVNNPPRDRKIPSAPVTSESITLIPVLLCFKKCDILMIFPR